MEPKRDHWFKIGILIALLLIAAPVAYYFVIYIPHRDAVQEYDKNAALVQQQDEASAAANEKQTQAVLLQGCLDGANTDYNSNWSSNCVSEGKASTCTTLYANDAKSVTDFRTQEENNCFKQYPQN